MSIIECNKDCTKVDDRGYPWGYECLKYGNSVLQEDFRNTKTFCGSE